MARKRPAVPGRPATGTAGILRFQNRTLTVMRGFAAGDAGDLSDAGVPVATGIPAALAETADQVFDPASQTRRTIRSVTCVVPHWADIDDDDTLLDEFTGYYFMIEGIEERPGIGYYPAQKILTLRMRSGVSAASD